MATWVLRNRKRLSYESTFIVQAHELNQRKPDTAEPAVYPDGLAIRLAKRGIVISAEKEKVKEGRRSSESALEDKVKVETSSFI